MTYTVAVIEVPNQVYALFHDKLSAAGYDHALDSATSTINMAGLALVPETPNKDDKPFETKVTPEELKRYQDKVSQTDTDMVTMKKETLSNLLQLAEITLTVFSKK